MQVEVGIDFIFRLSDRFSLTPAQAFERFCRLQPFLISPPFDYILAASLRKPCPFFGNGCRIHDLKPAACLTFPARASSLGYLGGFDAYPCLTGELPMPAEHELRLEERFRKIFHARQFLQLNEDILYSKNQPYMNLEKSAKADPELKKIIRIIKQGRPLGDSAKTRLKEIIRNGLVSQLSEADISENLGTIKTAQKRAVLKLNRLYSRMRKKHRI
jgi:Fe-S-cluster containining protein